MRTYAESKGKKPFNWFEFLERKDITDSEWVDAYTLSTNWITCACGNQCDVIPRDWVGAPIDSYLRVLGNDFTDYMKSRDQLSAMETLHLIEKRSIELINKWEEQNELQTK